jgi:hypothetical protein
MNAGSGAGNQSGKTRPLPCAQRDAALPVALGPLAALDLAAAGTGRRRHQPVSAHDRDRSRHPQSELSAGVAGGPHTAPVRRRERDRRAASCHGLRAGKHGPARKLGPAATAALRWDEYPSIVPKAGIRDVRRIRARAAIGMWAAVELSMSACSAISVPGFSGAFATTAATAAGGAGSATAGTRDSRTFVA